MHEDVATEDTAMTIFGAAIIAFALVGVYYVGRVSWRTIRRLKPKK